MREKVVENEVTHNNSSTGGTFDFYSKWDRKKLQEDFAQRNYIDWLML